MTFEAPTTSRRERRAAARKAQILAAAATVFSQKGYAQATTREIAAAADVSEGTLYNYFQDKRDLLIGVANAYADEVVNAFAETEPGDIEAMVAQLLSRRFRNSQERRLFMLFLYEARLNPDVHRYYVQESLVRIIKETEKRIQALIDRGIMRPVDPAVTARTISATIMGYSAMFEFRDDLWEELPTGNGESFSPERLGAQIADIYWHGLEAKEEGQ